MRRHGLLPLSRRASVAAASGIVVSACTFLRPLDDFTGGADASAGSDASAASAADASTADDAARADSPAGGDNLHPNGTFDEGCSGWVPFRATLSPSSVSRSGAGSCRVCSTGESGQFAARGDAVKDPPVGSEYRVEAWVRKDPTRVAPGPAGVLLRTTRRDPFTELEKRFGGAAIPADEWSRISTTLTVTRPADQLDVTVSAEEGSDVCFLVDDVVLVRTR